ncbi:MAG: hypothetical protein RJA22_2341 [Verrucomicrobiota bacterium]|jgi:chromosome segregation ATPase
MKPLVVILTVACLGLGGAVIWRHNTAQTIINEARENATRTQQQLTETRTKLTEQEQVATFSQTQLQQRLVELGTLSNELAQTRTSLAAAQESATVARADAQAKAARVAQLESEKDDLSRKLTELAGQIQSLDQQIAETKRKLAESEGDRTLLSKQLARLQADKAELLAKFNDLAVIRAQYVLLRDEAAINQRLAWMAQGVYARAERKGAESLMGRPAASGVKPDRSLNVELDQQGGVRTPPAESALPNK